MNKSSLLLSLLFTFLLAGCQSTAEKIAEQEQRAKVQSNRFHESDAQIKKLESRLTQAKKDQLLYFAPDKLEDAQNSYKDAKEDYDVILADRSEASKSKTQRILRNIQEANRRLDDGYIIKKNAETILAEAFDIHEQLKVLKASLIEPKTFLSLKRDIDEIVEDVADGDLDDARRDTAKLLPLLRAFEIRIVKIKELKTLEGRMAQLEKADADRLAPNTYQKAQSALAGAESTIASDPRNKETIKAAIDKASFFIDRAAVITNAVNELSNLRRSGHEIYLLKREAQLLKISQELADQDFRNMPVKQQTEEILRLAQELKTEKEELETQVASLEKTMVADDKKENATITQLKQEKAELKHKLQLKSQELAAQQEAELSHQQRIATLNDTINQLEVQDLEKQRKLITFERQNLGLQQQLLQLQAQISAPTHTAIAPSPVSTETSSSNVSEQSVEPEENEQEMVEEPETEDEPPKHRYP